MNGKYGLRIALNFPQRGVSRNRDNQVTALAALGAFMPRVHSPGASPSGGFRFGSD